MKDIEKNISALVESQFPAFYVEEGPKFISFIKAYYEWMESTNNSTYHSRRLLNYRDIDETIDDFIINFKEKYLNNIQFTTSSNKKLLIKKSQDLYRTKGTERSIDLFFKLVYGINTDVYVPGEDIFRLSDGEWIKPEYLEVTREVRNISYVGKEIRGADSGAIAFVERLVRRRVKSKYIDIFYITARNGTFNTSEILLIDDVFDGAPVMVGSMTNLELIDKSSGYKIGDIVDIISENGAQGKARVSSVSNATGIVEFDLIDGGFGYTTASDVLISEKVLTLTNVDVSNSSLKFPFTQFETVTQPLANVQYQSVLTFTLASNTGAFTNGEVIYQALSGSNTALATVIASNSTILTAKYANTGEFSTTLQIKGATSTSNGVISAISAPSAADYNAQDQIYTSYYSNGVIAGQGLVVVNVSNSVPYSGVLKVAISNGNINDTANANYVNYFYVGNTSSPNTIQATVNTYFDVSATGNVIGVSNTIILNTSEYTPTYQLNERINQGTTANGVLIAISQSGSNAALTVSSVSGVFTVGTRVVGANSAASSNVQNFGLNIGLYDINNSFTNSYSHHISGVDTGTTANVVSISTGTGASFQIGSLDNEEQIVLGTDYINGRNSSNVAYRTLALNASVFGFPKFPSGNLTYGTLIQQLTYVTANIGTISAITNINPGTNYNVDPIVAVYSPFVAPANRKDLLLQYERTTINVFIDNEIIEQSRAVANTITLTLSNVIANSFAVGEFVSQSSNASTGYVYSTNIVANNGTMILRNTGGVAFTNTANVIGFTSGAQSAVSLVNSVFVSATAKGVVKSSNSTVLVVKPISFNTQFEPSGFVSGRSSAANGKIIAITTDVNSKAAGINAEITADVITANGVVTGLQRIDSGFGYIEDEIATFSKEGLNSGTAKLHLVEQGIGEGYHKSTKGFLSQDKYLFDGEYYQEYSYEIISKLPFEKYSDIFKQVMHTAGTEVFGSVSLDSIGTVNAVAVGPDDKIYKMTVTGMSNTNNYAVNEVIFQSNGSANVATGKLKETKGTVIRLTTSANVRYQEGEYIYQPNSAVNTASGILVGKTANATANTLTLYLSNVQGTFVSTANVQGTTNTVLTVQSHILTQFRNIINGASLTGSFDLGETVTTAGGFTGIIEVANQFDAELIPVSGSLAEDDQLTGTISGATAFVEKIGALVPTVGDIVFEPNHDVFINGANGAFANGEYVFQYRQNVSKANQIFEYTTYGTVISANSTVLRLSDKFGVFTKNETIYGANSGATAKVASVITTHAAEGEVIAANTTSITVVDVFGQFISNSHVYSTNTAAYVTSITKATRITPTSNVASAINSILVANVSGTFVTDYQVDGNISGANATVTYIETYND